jgi:hypothetical protein
MMCYGRLENLGCIRYFHALKQKVCVKASQWDENELVKLNSNEVKLCKPRKVSLLQFGVKLVHKWIIGNSHSQDSSSHEFGEELTFSSI